MNTNIPTGQSNFLLACWAVSLISGDNILGLNIKSTTVKGYMKAAAKLYVRAELPDPFNNSNVTVNYPEIIITALSKYESKPDRKEPVTDSMFLYIAEQARASRQDSMLAALKDWFAWSRYGGPRRAEWCQTTMTKYQTVEHGPPNEAAAFRLDDITFYTKRGLRIDPNNISALSIVHHAKVRWRYQKNEDNGEEITYYLDKSNPEWCPCLSLWNIVQRALRLRIPSHEPIAQYRNDKNVRVYITDKNVNDTLQKAASKVLGIKDTNVLRKWTTHSLRVTAANELHRRNFSGEFIKKRLRWRSDAFLGYLRNTIHIARTHTLAMQLSSINLNTEKEEASGIVIYDRPEEDKLLWNNLSEYV